MKKDILEIIEIPEGESVSIKENEISVSGPNGTLKKELQRYNIDLRVEDGKIIVESKKGSKREKRLAYTLIAHVKNMLAGVNKDFEYKLKICYSHFPITVDIKGTDVTVKNFLGEKIPRKTNILKGVKVRVDKEFIIITSSSKELVGQTAANLERVTKITDKDRRIFQDGIYLTHRNGVGV